MFKNSKKKLAEAFNKQLDSVKFSTDEEINNITTNVALWNNYNVNMAKLGWAITNLSPDMKKAYNGKGLDKYRFVTMKNSQPKTVNEALRDTVTEGYTQRKIMRAIIPKNLKNADDIKQKITDSAKNKRSQSNSDFDDDMSIAPLHAARKEIYSFGSQKLENGKTLDIKKLNNLLNMNSEVSLLKQCKTYIEKLIDRWEAYTKLYCERLPKLEKESKPKQDDETCC